LPSIPRLRVLIVDTYYPALLSAHYERHTGLERRAYGEQLSSLIGLRFGTSDAYSHHLRELGHEAAEVVVNCEELQFRWAEERGMAQLFRNAAGRAPGKLGKAARQLLLHRIADAQIREFDPDVVYLQDLGFFGRRELERLRAQGRLVVGQLASPPPSRRRLGAFDLITTSFPHFVDRFRAQGLDAEYLKIAFYEPVLDCLRSDGVDPDARAKRPHPVSFVGGLNPAVHGAGTALLERVCRRTELAVWGWGAEALREGSPILERYRGQAWGLDMYRVLARSRIVINRHIEAAEEYANNMRLFEATGVGALLLTEQRRNIADLFEPGREVVVYEGADDLVEKIEHYVRHEEERREIATAGQRRTLAEHTYGRRITELAGMLEARLTSGGTRLP
jgi:hypothetical protein